MCWSHIASALTLRGHPHGQVRENHLDVEGFSPLGCAKNNNNSNKDERKKKYQERKCGVSEVLVRIVCGNPASVLSSLNTHCRKMYALAHTHAHPPTHRKRQGVRLVHSGSLASSQPLNTSTAHYSVAWQALSHMLALRTSEDYPATRFRQQSHIYIYTTHSFIFHILSTRLSLCTSVLLTLLWRAQSSSFCSYIMLPPLPASLHNRSTLQFRMLNKTSESIQVMTALFTASQCQTCF